MTDKPDEIDEILKKYKVTLVSQTFRLCDAFNTDKTDSLDGTDYKLTKMIYIPVDDLRSLKKKWQAEASIKSKKSVIKDCKLNYSTFGHSEHYINCNALTNKLNDEINQLNGDK